MKFRQEVTKKAIKAALKRCARLQNFIKVHLKIKLNMVKK